MGKFVLFAFVVLLLASCSDANSQWWEMENADGRLFVLNKRTGEVLTLEHSELQILARSSTIWTGPETPTDIEEVAREHKLSRSRWMFDDIMKVSVNTKYIGGKLKIRGTIEPAISTFRDRYGGAVVTLQFSDFDEFDLVQVAIEPGDLTQMVDENGDPQSYEFNREVSVSARDWSEVFGFNVLYTGSTESKVKAWEKTNPNDAATRRGLAESEREELRERFREMLREQDAANGDSESPEDGDSPSRDDAASTSQDPTVSG